MQICVTVILCTLLFTLLVSTVFFSKKRINLAENKIYSFLLIISNIGLVLEALCCYFVANMDKSLYHGFLNLLINKIFLVYMLTWLLAFAFYTYFISNKQKKKNNRNLEIPTLLKIIYTIFVVITLSLPVNFYNESGYVYSYGMGPNFITLIGGLTIFLNLFMILKNHNNIREKKYYPLFILIFLMIIALILRNINPGLVLINSLFGFITGLMFFTIENPDLQMINELYKNKELVEQIYEDKSNFLFELTQEIRGPLSNISKISKDLKDENDIKYLKDGLKEINNSIRQLDFIVNDVLNVSTLDVQKVKIIDGRYNLKSLFEDVATRIKGNLNNPNVEFRTNIPNTVPYFYGDSIKLKQILFSLLINSVKKTSNGFIEFSVNIIEKYDVCRVIFTITDSGSGMSIDKINEVLSVTGEFDQNDIKELEKSELNIKLCQKIIKALGGNLLIKSVAGKGTEVMLTIDQKIYNKDNMNDALNLYSNALSDNKKVLIICQDKNITHILKKKLNDNNIDCSLILYGADAIDRLKSGKKYDYIIIQDDMKEMSGLTTLNEMKKIDKFNIPVIVMINRVKDGIKEEYIKDGFKDYIFIDRLSEEINRIIDKY